MSDFHPGWDPQVFGEQRVTAPCSVSIEYRVSDRWKKNNIEPKELVGDRILGVYRSYLTSFIDGLRINAANAALPYFFKTLQLPGVELRYVKQNGLESVRIVVTPETYGGTSPTTLQVSPSDIIKVKKDFIGWPIPGYNNTLAASFDPLQGPGEAYWWDFASTPGWPKQDGPNGMRLDGLIATYIDAGQSVSIDDPPGWTSVFQQRIQAGSQVVPVPLADKQYWEVEIGELAGDQLPASQTWQNPTVHGDNATTVTCDLFTLNSTGMRIRSFPSKLNTFLSPCIGVICENALVKSDKSTDAKPAYKNTTPAIMGLEHDPDPNSGRSVFVTRASFDTEKIITTRIDTYPTGGGLIHDTGVEVFLLGQKDLTYIPGLNLGVAIVELDPTTGKSATFTQSGSLTLFACNGKIWKIANRIDDLFVFVSPLPDAIGDGFEATAYMHSESAGGDFNLPCFQVGTYPGTATVQDYIHSTGEHTVDVTYMPPGSTQKVVTDTSPRQFGDGWLIKNSWTADQLPADGRYAPVIQGRADVAKLDYREDWIDGGWIAELGDLQKGDILRFVTEMATKKNPIVYKGKNWAGRIWIGKNKSWYQPGNPVIKPSPVDTFDDKLTPMAYLDGGADPDKLLRYYPAVSWRVGPVDLKIRLGTATKFQPPKGVNPIILTEPFTVPGPDVDDTSGKV